MQLTNYAYLRIISIFVFQLPLPASVFPAIFRGTILVLQEVRRRLHILLITVEKNKRSRPIS